MLPASIADIAAAVLVLGLGAWLTLYGGVSLAFVDADDRALDLRHGISTTACGLVFFVMAALALLSFGL
ncbi:MAG TPA: hypothetical protein VFO80_02575 [Sphingomonas sp.]|nr:hypothetical protein [Sphingomonas sp.]